MVWFLRYWPGCFFWHYMPACLYYWPTGLMRAAPLAITHHKGRVTSRVFCFLPLTGPITAVRKLLDDCFADGEVLSSHSLHLLLFHRKKFTGAYEAGPGLYKLSILCLDTFTPRYIPLGLYEPESLDHFFKLQSGNCSTIALLMAKCYHLLCFTCFYSMGKNSRDRISPGQACTSSASYA